MANVLVVIAGIVVISLSLALGFFMLLGIAGFVCVMAIVVGIRNWWRRRRFGAKAERSGPQEQTGGHQPRIIEGEYQQVEDPVKRDDDHRHP